MSVAHLSLVWSLVRQYILYGGRQYIPGVPCRLDCCTFITVEFNKFLESGIPCRLECCWVGFKLGGIFVLGGSVGAVGGIKVDFCAAAGATASASVIVQGSIFVVVAVSIAWNATDALYEFFVVGLGLV